MNYKYREENGDIFVEYGVNQAPEQFITAHNTKHRPPHENIAALWANDDDMAHLSDKSWTATRPHTNGVRYPQWYDMWSSHLDWQLAFDQELTDLKHDLDTRLGEGIQGLLR